MPISRKIIDGVLCAMFCLGCVQQVRPLPADPQAGTLWTNSIGLKLVWIPPEPVREVGRDWATPQIAIRQGFYMGIYEVSQRQYKKVMGSNPSQYKHDNCPVESVTWYQAVDFCALLSTMEGKTYRLPTEAEWVHACRAQSTTTYFFGEDASQMRKYAWDKHTTPQFYLSDMITFIIGSPAEKATSSWGFPPRPQPVGKKKPNDWGLHDMYGNVREWCQDPYEPDHPERVLKGGSYEDDGVFSCRCENRFRCHPENRCMENGFRIVLDLNESFSWPSSSLNARFFKSAFCLP
ncbi:MAG: formylglycine-generating enzyme family protein [Phycisphaerae bacterium]|nr:formylglycine-generating enzyme family protein [Phycisphaerae bacterium]